MHQAVSMSTNKQVRWKNNRIISIRLRNDHYVLVQMLQPNGAIAVFDIFKEEDKWDDVKLTKDTVLFTGFLVNNVLKRSTVNIHTDVVPVDGLKYPDLHIYIGSGFRDVTLWEGTKDERTFLMMGKGSNELREVYTENGLLQEKYTPISNNDYEKYSELELTNLCAYPTFNERLYLCETFGRNIDPLKELAFNRPLDKKCAVYIDIIAGKIPIAKLGY